MEYVSGHDVQTVLTVLMGQALGIEMAVTSLRRSAKRSVYLAINNMGEPLSLIHRDVSPQNILVGYDGQ